MGYAGRYSPKIERTPVFQLSLHMTENGSHKKRKTLKHKTPQLV
jgi:hypothetical protein